MYKQLDLFNKSQPSDLEKLDDMVSYQEPDGVSSQIDWDIQVAYDCGDTVRYQELLQIKADMN